MEKKSVYGMRASNNGWFKKKKIMSVYYGMSPVSKYRDFGVYSMNKPASVTVSSYIVKYKSLFMAWNSFIFTKTG
jgi:hypothetical protein